MDRPNKEGKLSISDTHFHFRYSVCLIKILAPSTVSAQVEKEDHMKNSKGTIVLFGWAGCRERYLSKYSDFYEENG